LIWLRAESLYPPTKDGGNPQDARSPVALPDPSLTSTRSPVELLGGGTAAYFRQGVCTEARSRKGGGSVRSHDGLLVMADGVGVIWHLPNTAPGSCAPDLALVAPGRCFSPRGDRWWARGGLPDHRSGGLGGLPDRGVDGGFGGGSVASARCRWQARSVEVGVGVGGRDMVGQC
jgi:hypothetical protein